MRLPRWRFAARLAGREVRRRPGRTLLVTVLVAVPVMAMTVASVLVRTGADPWAERFIRSHGSADIIGFTSSANKSDVDRALESALPEGSKWESANVVFATARNGKQRVDVEFTDISLDSPITKGILEVRAGRAPAGADEVAVDADTADRLDVTVGDTLTLTSPAGQWKVSGIVRKAERWGQRMIVFGGFDWTRCRFGACYQRLYIDLPPGTSVDETATVLAALNQADQFVARDIPPDYISEDGDVPAETIAWGWVIGALALCVLGIIIASAFATSARRQLVTLGQLSSNGADQVLLRRTMALQGSWSGLVGSLTGAGLGLIGIVAGRGTIERLVEHHLGAYEIAISDLAIITMTGVLAATIAALVPARSIAKVPVMAALSGRRPLGTVPRRLMPIGLGLFGGGVFLLVIAATGSSDGSDSDLFAVVAILGGLGVLFGMCCLTPRMVDLLGSVGSRCAGSWRLSARSLARTRTRSAGVVTAVAAAGALAVGGSAVFAASTAETQTSAVLQIPEDTVFISANLWSNEQIISEPQSPDFASTVDAPGYRPTPIPAETLEAVRSVVPGREIERRVAVWDPAPYDVDSGGNRLDGLITDDSGVMVIADPDILDMIGLSDNDRERLADVGVLNIQGAYMATPDFNVTASSFGIHPNGRGRITIEAIAPTAQIKSTAAVWPPLVTFERARQLGLDITTDGLYIRSGSPLDDDQLDALQQIQNDRWNATEVFDPPQASAGGTEVQVSITPSYRPPEVASETVVGMAISVVALLFTLLVVAIGLALSAAESRDERDVLVAVGARPSTLRRVAGQKAAMLALVGTALGVPTGLIPVVMVLRSMRQTPGELPLDIPWLVIGMLVVSVPLAAGVVTWASSVIAQRVRPVRMSTLALD